MLDTVVKNLPFKVSDRTFVAVTAYTPMMFIVHPELALQDLARGGRCDEEGHRDLHLDVARRRRRAGHGVPPLRRRGRRRRRQDARGCAEGRRGGRDDDRRRPCPARHRHVERHCRSAQRRQAARAGGRRSRALARARCAHDQGGRHPRHRGARSGSASPAHPACPPTSWPPGMRRSRRCWPTRPCRRRCSTPASSPRTRTAKAMTARVEQDRKLTQTLFGH